MSLRLRLILTPSVMLWLIGLIAMGHLHLAWAGGDLSQLRSEFLQQASVQTEPQLAQSPTGSKQPQPGSQSRLIIQVESQAASAPPRISEASMMQPGQLLLHHFDWRWLASGGGLPVYAGMGARFRFRVPIGVESMTASRIISLFLEAGPVINFIPTADVDVNFGLGIGFFFSRPDDKAKTVS